MIVRSLTGIKFTCWNKCRFNTRNEPQQWQT